MTVLAGKYFYYDLSAANPSEFICFSFEGTGETNDILMLLTTDDEFPNYERNSTTKNVFYTGRCNQERVEEVRVRGGSYKLVLDNVTPSALDREIRVVVKQYPAR